MPQHSQLIKQHYRHAIVGRSKMDLPVEVEAMGGWKDAYEALRREGESSIQYIDLAEGSSELGLPIEVEAMGVRKDAFEALRREGELFCVQLVGLTRDYHACACVCGLS